MAAAGNWIITNCGEPCWQICESLHGVSNHWTGKRTGMVEWTMEWTLVFFAYSRQHHFLAFIPFHSVRPQESLFVEGAMYRTHIVLMLIKYTVDL